MQPDFQSQNIYCFEAFPVPGYVAAGYPQLMTTSTPNLEIDSKVSVKKRQKSLNTRLEIIANYKNELEKKWINCTITKLTWFNPELKLCCKKINPSNLPIGFTKTRENKYQYNFTDPNSLSKKRFRPLAYRIPFLQEKGFYDNTMTVSHLCHNSWCYNWNHHILESLAVNKSRNGCPAGNSCRHKVKCIIPGEYSDK